MTRFLLWAALAALLLVVARLVAGRASRKVGRGSPPAAESGRSREPSRSPQRTRAPDPSGPAPPPAPAPRGAGCWLPPGKATEVAGHPVPGGMVYRGSGLPAVHGAGLEPCLLDPAEPVGEVDAAFELGYWPSYQRIPPAARASLLQWLARGRKDPQVDPGCLFLFFYGLERRALHDAEHDPAARAELPELLAEIERLLGIYGGHRSFRGYASAFAELLRYDLGAEAMREGPPPRQRAGAGLPLSVRITAATCALRGEGLPAEWALSWLRCDPELKLRTPARRCPEEFGRLFLLRYRAAFGEGLKLKPCKRVIAVRYRPASPSFDQEVERKTGFPDVCALVAPRRKLQELADGCAEALSAYSRRVGREGEPGFALEATALLPADLVAEHPSGELLMLRESLAAKLGEQGHAVLAAEEAVEPWLPAASERLKKREGSQLLRLVGHAGFGVEPDLRFGGPALQRGKPMALFRLDAADGPAHQSPTAAYQAAALLLHLSVMISAADGAVSSVEEERLEAHLASGLHLDAEERLRLRAHLSWLLADPPGTAGLKRRLGALDAEQRRGIGAFLVEVAWADGKVEAGEVRMLEKVYGLLQLPADQVHEDLHAGRPVDGGAEAGRGGGAPAPAGRSRSGLDAKALARKLEETAAVSSLLSGIFAEEEPEAGHASPALGGGAGAAAEAQAKAPAQAAEEAVPGLDPAHGALLLRLGERGCWPREDYEALAEELGVFPDGALDRINELAFERCDEALIEGDDALEVHPHVLEQLRP